MTGRDRACTGVQGRKCGSLHACMSGARHGRACAGVHERARTLEHKGAWGSMQGGA